MVTCPGRGWMERGNVEQGIQEENMASLSPGGKRLALGPTVGQPWIFLDNSWVTIPPSVAFPSGLLEDGF